MLLPGEAVWRDDQFCFWRTMLRYWARFLPFWIGAAFGAGVTFLAMK
jgi:hypothetical protein